MKSPSCNLQSSTYFFVGFPYSGHLEVNTKNSKSGTRVIYLLLTSPQETLKGSKFCRAVHVVGYLGPVVQSRIKLILD